MSDLFFFPLHLSFFAATSYMLHWCKEQVSDEGYNYA